MKCSAWDIVDDMELAGVIAILLVIVCLMYRINSKLDLNERKTNAWRIETARLANVIEVKLGDIAYKLSRQP